MQVVAHVVCDAAKGVAYQTEIALYVANMVAPIHSMQATRHDVLVLYKARIGSHEPALWLQDVFDTRHYLSRGRVVHVMEQPKGHSDIK